MAAAKIIEKYVNDLLNMGDNRKLILNFVKIAILFQRELDIINTMNQETLF